MKLFVTNMTCCHSETEKKICLLKNSIFILHKCENPVGKVPCRHPKPLLTPHKPLPQTENLNLSPDREIRVITAKLCRFIHTQGPELHPNL